MLNRIAESLFWIGRYTERAENHARLINAYYHIREESEADEQQVWMRIIATIGDPESYLAKYGNYNEQDVLYEMTLNPEQSNSIISCVKYARINLRNVREKVPSELWDTLNRFYLWIKEKDVNEIVQESPHMFYKQIKDWLAMFQGTFYSIMVRDELWLLAESGRYLERSENTVRLLQSVYNAIEDNRTASYSYLTAILKSVSGHEAYQRDNSTGVNVDHIIGFLIRHEGFPRSLLCSISLLERQLKAIQRAESKPSSSFTSVIRVVGKIRSDLEFLELMDIKYENLGDFLTTMHKTNGHLAQTFAKSFFQLDEGVGA